jgi:hypothetical protein
MPPKSGITIDAHRESRLFRGLDKRAYIAVHFCRFFMNYPMRAIGYTLDSQLRNKFAEVVEIARNQRGIFFAPNY